jgi:hypothetical protein
MMLSDAVRRACPPTYFDVLMRPQTRPFTVEIKNSRRPMRARSAASTLADRPRAEHVSQNLHLEDTRVSVQDRSPAQEAAFSEAHRLFRRLTDPAPAPAPSSGLLRFAPQGTEGEAVAPEQDRTAERGEEPRQARILPDLLSPSLPDVPLSGRTEKRSSARRKAHGPKTQERIGGQPEGSPGLDPGALLDAGHEHSEPAEMGRPALSDAPDMVAAEQGAIPHSTSPEGGSPRPGRRSREVYPGWAYRAACRKAERRGKPLPQHASVKWKRR